LSEEAKDPKAFVLKGATSGGIPGVKPPNPEDLPPEEQFQLSNNPELYGEFTDEDRQVARERMETVTTTTKQKENPTAMNFMAAISEQAGKDLAYYAESEEYDIEMDDGSIKKYYRVAPTQHEWDKLEDLRAEVEGGEALDDGHKLTKRQHRLKTRLLEQLKAKYYLINAETNKPMTAEEHAHVKNSGRIGSILDACVVVSLHKAVVGKK
jgi:hypothetical protein